MQAVLDAFLSHDIRALIEAVGLAGVYGIIFAESGLLIGFFLPGDSLLFTAGFLASPAVGFFNIWSLMIGSWIAAVVGDNVGYIFGKRVGRKLFRREDSLLFKKANLIKAQQFYEDYGNKAIVIARFMPIVRTFAPIVAGMGKMNQRRFALYNVVGGFLWTFGISGLGFFLGSVIPNVDKYLLPIILAIVVLSVVPPVMHMYKESQKNPIEHAKEILSKIKYYILSFIPSKDKKE